MGPAKSLAEQGHVYQLTQRGVRASCGIGRVSEDEADAPPPNDFLRYPKFGRLTASISPYIIRDSG